MHVRSTVPGLGPEGVRAALAGLPEAKGYDLLVRPLRYRTRPHLAAVTDFTARGITIQIPEPFLPFGEVVPYAARRVAAKGLRFVWLSEGVTFTRPRQVLRFLYLHEWLHWYQRERLGRRGAAETACDRFALRNYRRRAVGEEDALAALRSARRTE